MTREELAAITAENRDVIDRIIEREGRKFTSRPSDRGGATNYGITEETLDAQDGIEGNQTAEDVRKLTLAEARLLYAAEYVAPFAGIPDKRLRSALIDFGVHSGAKTAARILQGLIGAEPDGIIGPETLRRLAVAPTEAVRLESIAARLHLLGNLITKHDKAVEDAIGSLLLKLVAADDAEERKRLAEKVATNLSKMQFHNAAGWMNRVGGVLTEE